MLAAADNDRVRRQTVVFGEDGQIRAGHLPQEKLNVPSPARVRRRSVGGEEDHIRRMTVLDQRQVGSKQRSGGNDNENRKKMPGHKVSRG